METCSGCRVVKGGWPHIVHLIFESFLVGHAAKAEFYKPVVPELEVLPSTSTMGHEFAPRPHGHCRKIAVPSHDHREVVMLLGVCGIAGHVWDGMEGGYQLPSGSIHGCLGQGVCSSQLHGETVQLHHQLEPRGVQLHVL